MSALKILLRDDRTRFRPGEIIEGVAGWQVDQPANMLERVLAATMRLELRLFWFTRGKGTEDVQVVQTVHYSAPQLDEARRFSLKCPDAPFSFSGQLVSLIWALELVLNPGDVSTRLEIIVSPTGEEILLHQHAGT